MVEYLHWPEWGPLPIKHSFLLDHHHRRRRHRLWMGLRMIKQAWLLGNQVDVLIVHQMHSQAAGLACESIAMVLFLIRSANSICSNYWTVQCNNKRNKATTTCFALSRISISGHWSMMSTLVVRSLARSLKVLDQTLEIYSSHTHTHQSPNMFDCWVWQAWSCEMYQKPFIPFIQSPFHKRLDSNGNSSIDCQGTRTQAWTVSASSLFCM